MEDWGVEGAKDWDGFDASCKDGSDLYRPIVKAKETGRQHSKPDKNRHNSDREYSSDGEYSGDGEYSDDEDYGENNFVKAEEAGRQPSQGQLWKTGPLTEEIYNRYLKGKEEYKNYVKDDTTNLMMAATTKEACKANNGFVCKVKLDAGDMASMIMMMTKG